MGDDNGVLLAVDFGALKQRLDVEVTEAFRAKELARAQVDALTESIPESVKVEILLAASVYAQKLAAYVRARDRYEAMEFTR